MVHMIGQCWNKNHFLSDFYLTPLSFCPLSKEPNNRVGVAALQHVLPNLKIKLPGSSCLLLLMYSTQLHLIIVFQQMLINITHPRILVAAHNYIKTVFLSLEEALK